MTAPKRLSVGCIGAGQIVREQHVLEGSAKLLDRQAIDCLMFEYADGWISSRRFLQEAAYYFEQKLYLLFRLFIEFLQPFSYSNAAERFDLGCMYVAFSWNYLQSLCPSIHDVLGVAPPVK